jgi:hypothetical protein
LEELPSTLLEQIPKDKCPKVVAWWIGITPTDRAEIIDLCDDRWDACFFGPKVDNLPLVRAGEFLVSHEEWWFNDWEEDWREYLVEHPDVVIAAKFQPRCTLTSEGQICIHVDWGRTRFSGQELPPSEQR